AGSGKTVCVTGAGGYIASWLVKLLLSRGYAVHGTVRHLGEEKTGHLRRLENASESLRLFKADLLDYDAMAAAVVGCQGVFHVATPLQMLGPAVTGTTNVLKAASAANAVRVVVVSSMVAVEINPKDWPQELVPCC
uniref:NAD(P)-binding domain-containing protein n=1 Tax=Aegilops tauschii subsp. strangulata TaxID=200361 RepID=A0A453L538_AEGTS